MKTYGLEDIGKMCGVKGGSISNFIKYCIEVGRDVPNPIPYQKNYYTYDEESALKIAEMFKNKKRGEMADFNYRHNWGSKFRDKYKR